MRSYDPSLLAPAIELYLGENAYKEDPIVWLSDPRNIMLQNEYGDIALFEPRIAGQYSGHYFFKSRGRVAINAGKAFLDELFNSCYNISVLVGLAPIDNKAARWMSRQLGFKSYGPTNLDDLNFELFIITKKEFNNE